MCPLRPRIPIKGMTSELTFDIIFIDDWTLNDFGLCMPPCGALS